jgi:methylmalonyl-CoA/ethylmalonyl-CoA epimerase
MLGIDHIGLVTAEPAALAPLLTALGMSKIDDGFAPEYRVACEFWQQAGRTGQPSVELVSPVGAGSAVDGHLAKHGPGLHHIAMEVDRIEPELERLREAGFTAVDRAPCAGARLGMLVAFTYLARPAGLLVELVQYSRDGIARVGGPATPPQPPDWPRARSWPHRRSRQ